MRKPTNGASLERGGERASETGGGKNGFSYDRDKNGERLPLRPTSLDAIRQPGDEDFQEMHCYLPLGVNKTHSVPTPLLSVF